MAKKYSVGIDYGTLSGRCVVVDVVNGAIVGESVWNYTNGVIDRELPGLGVKLGHDWALQDPNDYLLVLKKTVRRALAAAKVRPEQVIGLGTDFTGCTMLPIDKNGRPLCLDAKWRRNPHAWVKLWKHHAAQPQANRLNEIAARRREKWLPLYGGKISSEWLFPKIMQIVEEAPEVYDACDRIIEACDWITMVLTGAEKRSACAAGYKAIWSKRDGYPSKSFLRALNPRMENVVAEKLSCDVVPAGSFAGRLTKEGARLTGLCEGLPVAAGIFDAHVAVPACTVTKPGQMVMILGTSNCTMILGDRIAVAPGMCGAVEDGIVPGYIGFEAGQSGFGDIYAWFVDNCVNSATERAAKKARMDVHRYLTEKAAAYAPGETGLLALDWWNGNRSVLVDADLTGLILGMNLTTPPAAIYRALIEATCFGTREIVENFERSGVRVKELFACGGIAQKSTLVMQIMADVTGRTIRIADSTETVALGAAINGAVVAGRKNGGYDDIARAARKMARVKKHVYRPDKKAHATYNRLFAEYERLHDCFGRGENPVMKVLKDIKTGAQRKK